MKKISSVVWQFFDRLEEDKKCVAVLCKLCDTEYKYFGNTTNLRAHLIKKHPIQWEFRQSNVDGEEKPVSETVVIRQYADHADDESTNQSVSSRPKRKKYNRSTDQTTTYEASDGDPEAAEDEEASINLVRQMHGQTASEEEWLEEDYVRLYEPSRKKIRKIKREVVSPERSPYARRSTANTKHQVEKIIENTQKDEYSVFGEYIANKLRKFKSSRTKANIQQIMTTILWQAEYGMYDDVESVKRVLAQSIQTCESDKHNESQIVLNLSSVAHQHHYDETNKTIEEANQCDEAAALSS